MNELLQNKEIFPRTTTHNYVLESVPIKNNHSASKSAEKTLDFMNRIKNIKSRNIPNKIRDKLNNTINYSKLEDISMNEPQTFKNIGQKSNYHNSLRKGIALNNNINYKSTSEQKDYKNFSFTLNVNQKINTKICTKTPNINSSFDDRKLIMDANDSLRNCGTSAETDRVKKNDKGFMKKLYNSATKNMSLSDRNNLSNKIRLKQKDNIQSCLKSRVINKTLQDSVQKPYNKLLGVSKLSQETQNTSEINPRVLKFTSNFLKNKHENTNRIYETKRPKPIFIEKLMSDLIKTNDNNQTEDDANRLKKDTETQYKSKDRFDTLRDIPRLERHRPKDIRTISKKLLVSKTMDENYPEGCEKHMDRLFSLHKKQNSVSRDKTEGLQDQKIQLSKDLEKYIKLEKGFKELEEHNLFDFIPFKHKELQYKILKTETEIKKETKIMKLDIENLKSGEKSRISKIRSIKDVSAQSNTGNNFKSLGNYYKKFFDGEDGKDSNTDIIVSSGIIPDAIFNRDDFKNFYEKLYSENIGRIKNIYMSRKGPEQLSDNETKIVAAYLTKLDPFKEMKFGFLRYLAKFFKHKEFENNSVFKKGDVLDFCIILLKGNLNITIESDGFQFKGLNIKQLSQRVRHSFLVPFNSKDIIKKHLDGKNNDPRKVIQNIVKKINRKKVVHKAVMVYNAAVLKDKISKPAGCEANVYGDADMLFLYQSDFQKAKDEYKEKCTAEIGQKKMRQNVSISGKKQVVSPLSPNKYAINYSREQKKKLAGFKSNFAKAIMKALMPARSASKLSRNKKSIMSLTKMSSPEEDKKKRKRQDEDSPEIKRNKMLTTIVSRTIGMRTKALSPKSDKNLKFKQISTNVGNKNIRNNESMVEIQLINGGIVKKTQKVQTSLESLDSNESNSDNNKKKDEKSEVINKALVNNQLMKIFNQRKLIKKQMVADDFTEESSSGDSDVQSSNSDYTIIKSINQKKKLTFDEQKIDSSLYANAPRRFELSKDSIDMEVAKKYKKGTSERKNNVDDYKHNNIRFIYESKVINSFDNV